MFTREADTETTTSTGKLLGLFLLLAVLCGVFFVLGYSFGRSTAAASLKPATANPAAPKPSASVDDPAPNKPYITTTPPPGSIPAPEDPAVPPATASPYPDPNPAPYLPPTTKRGRAAQNVPAYKPPPAPAPAPPVRRQAAAEPARSNAPQGSYVVQVAAVSKKQDAEALSSALRRKQYQVFVAQNEPNGLFRVQIGPFGDRRDAEVVRLLLVSDGYTPIVK